MPQTKKLTVGFSYNQKRVTPGVEPGADAEAEFDSPKTLDAIRSAIRSFGHTVVDLEAVPDLPRRLLETKVDLVFNIAEGIQGRNRESQVPALLELLGIPYTGSDPATLSIALDKGLAKRIVHSAGVSTAKFLLLNTGREKIPAPFSYPLFLKPVSEGSSKGVLQKSVVHSETELRGFAKLLIERYRQPAIAEEFLPGREFTVGILGEKRLKVLPPMEIVFLKKEEQFPVYTFEHKLDTNPEVRYDVPANLTPDLKAKVEEVARKSFLALGCRDVARIDIRLNAAGEPCFIECNPLPGLSPDWSDLCMIGKSAGLSYQDLIGEIMRPALRRLAASREQKGSHHDQN